MVHVPEWAAGHGLVRSLRPAHHPLAQAELGGALRERHDVLLRPLERHLEA